MTGDEFTATYDPGAAAQLLTDAGWRFDGDGFWQDPTGGEVSIRWLVDPGHGRQNRLVEVLEPSLAVLGFRVEVVECRGDCVFEERLGALDYDMAFVTTADPPGVGPSLRRYTCAEVPGAVLGRNFGGWCDQEATALLKLAAGSTDEAEVAEAMAGVHRRLAETRQMLPMVRLPSAVAWRPDKLGPALTKIRESGARLNLNLLGEAVLGETEAQKRLGPLLDEIGKTLDAAQLEPDMVLAVIAELAHSPVSTIAPGAASLVWSRSGKRR